MDSTQWIMQPLSQQLFPNTCTLLEQGLQENVAPGFVIGLWKKEQPNHIWGTALGQRRYFPSKQPMEIDTVFDFSSLSKIFATATLTAFLIERGWLQWDTPLGHLFPSYHSPSIQIQHLLSHTAGFSDWKPYWKNLQTAFHPEPLYRIPIQKRQHLMKELVLMEIPETAPGQRALYSDISFLLLGFALEEVTQMTLNHAVEQFLWKPMGIQTAFYRLVQEDIEKSGLDHVAATEDSEWRGGILQGQVHDDNCWAMGGYAGHAGVFGTLYDLFHWIRSLLDGFLSPTTLQMMWAPVLKPPRCTRTRGWDTPSGEFSAAGNLFSNQTVGHLGFTGTSFWFDLEAQLAVGLLSNRVHPTRENQKIKKFRFHLHNAIRKDMVSSL